jgi:hypothetical protein
MLQSILMDLYDTLRLFLGIFLHLAHLLLRTNLPSE